MTARWAARATLVVLIAAGLAGCAAGGPVGSAEVDRTISATSSGPSERVVAPTETGRALAGRIIVIDPGHNGRNADHVEEIHRAVDAGGLSKECNTVGTQSDSGYTEAEFNWAVSRALTDLLEEDGATIVLTRTDNDGWGPCIDERATTARKAAADLLISVHADGNESPGARGFHVISPGRVPDYTDDTYRTSAVLAGDIRDALIDAGFAPSTYEGDAGLVTRTDLGTLNLAGVPAVLVECGNLRHEDDARVLLSETGQEQIARALADGIKRYLS